MSGLPSEADNANRSDRPGKMQENQSPRNPVLTFWQSKRICSDNAQQMVGAQSLFPDRLLARRDGKYLSQHGRQFEYGDDGQVVTGSACSGTSVYLQGLDLRATRIDAVQR